MKTGKDAGNPFVDLELSATFTRGGETLTPKGFYDGKGPVPGAVVEDELQAGPVLPAASINFFEGASCSLQAGSRCRK